jgi:hypothetical protein
VDHPLATYRHHDTNMSANPALLERDSVRVLEKGFAMPHLGPDTRARIRRALARNDVVLAGCYFHARRYQDAIRCLARAALRDWRECDHAVRFPLRVANRILS